MEHSLRRAFEYQSPRSIISIIIQANTGEILIDKPNTGLLRVVELPEENQLKQRCRRFSQHKEIYSVVFDVKGVNIELTNAKRYLQVWIDTKLMIEFNVKKTIEKAVQTLTILSRTVSNSKWRHIERKVACKVSRNTEEKTYFSL